MKCFEHTDLKSVCTVTHLVPPAVVDEQLQPQCARGTQWSMPSGAHNGFRIQVGLLQHNIHVVLQLFGMFYEDQLSQHVRPEVLLHSDDNTRRRWHRHGVWGSIGAYSSRLVHINTMYMLS